MHIIECELGRFARTRLNPAPLAFSLAMPLIEGNVEFAPNEALYQGIQARADKCLVINARGFYGR